MVFSTCPQCGGDLGHDLLLCRIELRRQNLSLIRERDGLRRTLLKALSALQKHERIDAFTLPAPSVAGMVAADIDPYEQGIMQLKKTLKGVEEHRDYVIRALNDAGAHRDGLSLALKDLREAILLMLSVDDIVRSPEFATVYNETAANGCCPSCDRCLCIDAHPGCSCVDCGGTGYYSG